MSWLNHPLYPYFCPICHTNRLVRIREKISVIQWFKVVFLSSALTYLFFSYTQYKMIFIFFPLLIFVEFKNRYLNRKALHCPTCDFDFYYYKIFPKTASEQAKNKLKLIESEYSSHSKQYQWLKKHYLPRKDV